MKVKNNKLLEPNQYAQFYSSLAKNPTLEKIPYVQQSLPSITKSALTFNNKMPQTSSFETANSKN
jgi:hypothetical protein